MTLTEYELGPDAIAYVRSELGKGRALARTLLNVPLERGSVITFLPAGIRTRDVTNFTSGGLASCQENEFVAEFVSGRLSEEPSRVCVFEHQLVEHSDVSQPGVAFFRKRPEVPFFTVGEDLFMFAHGDVSKDVVMRIVREAHWYPAIGVLSALPADDVPMGGSPGTPESLGQLADGVEHMLIGAYDGEAWLIWSR